MVDISVNPHLFTGSQPPDCTQPQPPRPRATPWPRMLLTTIHTARSWQFREVMIRSRQRNQRGTRDGIEAFERFTPWPSSEEAYLAESLCCGWASGGWQFTGLRNKRTLLFPGWWSYPRAYVRGGWSSPRSQTGSKRSQPDPNRSQPGPGPNRRLPTSKTLTRTILRGFARRRSWKSGALVRPHILRFRYWPFRAAALFWTNFQRSRALSNIALKMRGSSIPCLLTRRMLPSRMNITTSRYKSRRRDYRHARTPAITISRSSTISLPSRPGESVFTNSSRFWTQPTMSRIASWQINWRVWS